MTYVPTWAGFIYLAVVLDVWSRRVVGWAIGEAMTSDLVLAALNMALQQRRPRDVIHHSDQGSEYASIAFGERCNKMGVRSSTGTVGDAYDNAMAESFFATLECELIDRRKWESKTEARLALFTYIKGWYNPRRRHSALGRTSPVAFEARNSRNARARAAHRTRDTHRRRLRGGRHAAGGYPCAGDYRSALGSKPVTVRAMGSSPRSPPKRHPGRPPKSGRKPGSRLFFAPLPRWPREVSAVWLWRVCGAQAPWRCPGSSPRLQPPRKAALPFR